MINQNLLLTGDDGYNLTKSLRFRSSAGASLSRTPSVAGNQQTWTWSGWFKRGILSSTQPAIFSCGTYPTNLFQVIFDNGSTADIINITNYPNSTTPNLDLRTTQVFRDPSSWYHIIIATDTTQATNANRVKLYINGVQVTAFGTATYPAQNASLNINNNGITNNIGNRPTNSNPFDGYMTEINFIDGQALTPSSFGSTNALTGVWQPARYTGTYGTNGFYLPFTNTASTTALGYDSSGNGNNWTTNNFSISSNSTYDSINDVPTLTSATQANYAVLNPLDKRSLIELTNANLHVQADSSGSWGQVRSTVAFPTTGKWYWEFVFNTGTNSFSVNGIGNSGTSLSLDYAPSSWANVYQFMGSGTLYANNSSSSYGSSLSSGDVLMVAFDRDNSAIYFGKNGTWFNSSNPATQTSPAASSISTSLTFFPMCGSVNASGGDINFGQRPFSYTPPTGFVALNTYNLPTSTIVKGNTVMDATLYTGNGGATQTITNTAGFKPDLVWIKDRSNARNNDLLDSIRGPTTGLFSNLTNAEVTSGYLSSFNSNGFTTGNDVSTNGSGETYVGWQWQAGQGTNTTNTTGSITSTVSVNPTAGFSVVTYTGTGSNATVGHGLGVAPSMYIVKSRSNGGTYYDWAVYHTGLGGNTKTMWLNLTNTVGTYPSYWNSTSPTSSVFSLGNDITVNQSSATYVAYCWSEIAGFSKFGSYTGNGSSDGPFVYLGFRPRFIMFQCTTAGSNWTIVDTARSTYNAAVLALQPNVSSAENNYANYDFLSNGFKIRGTLTNEYNVSGQTYIYAAFAENPLKYSLAR